MANAELTTLDKNKFDHAVIKALTLVKGIVEAKPFLDNDRQKILALEKDAEKRALMGFGKVINMGVADVMDCDLVYVALDNMDFDWGCHPVLVLKRGEEIVGEEIRDEKRIAALSSQKNAWFMHSNFVVYKDRISFPRDLSQNLCYFELPSIPCDWLVLDPEEFRYKRAIFCNPATPADIYLKQTYFQSKDERGLGTILVGVKL